MNELEKIPHEEKPNTNSKLEILGRKVYKFALKQLVKLILANKLIASVCAVVFLMFTYTVYSAVFSGESKRPDIIKYVKIEKASSLIVSTIETHVQYEVYDESDDWFKDVPIFVTIPAHAPIENLSLYLLEYKNLKYLLLLQIREFISVL